MNNITFTTIDENFNNYKLLYKWTQNKNVYEWFEQRILSYQEVYNKYSKKIKDKEQTLLLINYNNIPIGLIQYYKSNYFKDNKTYEYDLFIGEDKYLNKGLGKIIINKINDYLFNNYDISRIILRPFKRNIRACNCYTKCNFKKIEEYDGYDTLNHKEKYIVYCKERNK